MAQTARRWSTIGVEPFHLASDTDRAHWHPLLSSIEAQLVLTRAAPGMLTGQGDYLYARTDGYIGSLVNLIVVGSYEAMANRYGTTTGVILTAIRIGPPPSAPGSPPPRGCSGAAPDTARPA